MRCVVFSRIGDTFGFVVNKYCARFGVAAAVYSFCVFHGLCFLN